MFKELLVYGLGAILSKSIVFFLVPVYTRIFTPEEYGLIEMLVLVNLFMTILVAMGTMASMNYYFNKDGENKEARRKLISGILQWQLFFGLCIIVLGMSLAVVLQEELASHDIRLWLLAAAFFGALFGQLSASMSTVLRLLFKPWSYLFVTLGASLVSVACGLLLVIQFHMGIIGYFLGLAAGGVMGMVWGATALRSLIDWQKGFWSEWPHLLRFGAPLVPGSLAAYLLTSMDRWFIVTWLDKEALALYAIGAKFALVVAVGVEVCMSVFQPYSMKIIHGHDHAWINAEIARLFRYYCGISLLVIILITCAAPYFFKFLVPTFYYQGYPIVGILSLSGVFFGGTYFSSLGTWKKEKPYLYSVCVVIALGSGAVLNVVLIPLFGIMGAAVATACAMLILLGSSFYFSQTLWKIDFQLHQAAWQLVVCLVAIVWFNVGFDAGLGGFILFPVILILMSIIIIPVLKRNDFFIDYPVQKVQVKELVNE